MPKLCSAAPELLAAANKSWKVENRITGVKVWLRSWVRYAGGVKSQQLSSFNWHQPVSNLRYLWSEGQRKKLYHWRRAPFISVHHMKLLIKACVEMLCQSSPTERISKKCSFALCYSDARVRLNFSWACLIWSTQSALLKERGETSSLCIFVVSFLKPSSSCCITSTHVFIISEQTRSHMLWVKCVSVLLTAQQAAKVHPSNRAGFSYSSVSLGIQDKELTLGSKPPGCCVRACLCVCVFARGCVCVTLSLTLYLCVSVCICLSRRCFRTQRQRKPRL